jgi:excisionase family DNA binding protein
MSEPVSVTVVDAPAWGAHADQLAQLLKHASASGVAAIPALSAVPSDPNGVATIVDPAYWSENVAALTDALALPTGPRVAGSDAASGAVTSAEERLTLTVEEAASLLGISRAFAYESVHRGDIPSIRLGRRILIPRTALIRLAEGESGTPGR